MWRQTYSKIQDEIFKKLIDVSKKAGMPHRYELTASSVAWCAPMKTKDSVRCDEVQKLPPERSQRSLRNEPRVGQPWRNPQENCQDSNGWEGGRTVTDCLEEAFFWMHDVIWIFNVFGVYWAILKHHWYLNPDLWNLMKSSSKKVLDGTSSQRPQTPRKLLRLCMSRDFCRPPPAILRSILQRPRWGDTRTAQLIYRWS